MVLKMSCFEVLDYSNLRKKSLENNPKLFSYVSKFSEDTNVKQSKLKDVPTITTALIFLKLVYITQASTR